MLYYRLSFRALLLRLQYLDYNESGDIGNLATLTASICPAPILLVASPGTGKTWASHQLMYMLADM